MIKEWVFNKREKSYRVKLEKWLLTGNEVSVNGKMYVEEKLDHNMGSKYNFKVDDIDLRLVISRPQWFVKTKQDLYVDGEWVQPLAPDVKQ